jgi:hypothetical protein
MNCDKKFLGCLRLETGGYALSLLHFGGSVIALVLYLNNLDRIHVNLWMTVSGLLFWTFHICAAILLLIGTNKVSFFLGIDTSIF